MNDSIIKYLEFSELGPELSAIKSDLILVVIDQQVEKLYAERLKLDQVFLNKRVVTFVSKQGESCKHFDEYQRALNFFLEAGIHRRAHLLSIGGGATSDLAGFVAATLLRGIPWSIVSTTLLASVDASIGGKVGINSSAGKNLVGAFHFPQTIWITPDFFETLDPVQLQSGCGEVFKYGFLDRMIADAITKKRPLKEIIRSCVDYKKRIVAQDPHEEGVRRILNLGHTFGHGFEAIAGMPHGLAVLLGMDFVFRLFKSEKALAKLEEWSALYQLPSASELYQLVKKNNGDFAALWGYVSKDKKMASKEKIEIVTVRDVGYHVLEEIEVEKLKNNAEVLWASI